eukprot:SAG11_NODE_15586_length_573_cov_0.544304_2_plen_31_part_01
MNQTMLNSVLIAFVFSTGRAPFDAAVEAERN